MKMDINFFSKAKNTLILGNSSDSRCLFLQNANEEEGDEDNGNAGILSGPLFYETLKALAVALVCFFIFFPFVKKLAVLRRSRKIDPNGMNFIITSFKLHIPGEPEKSSHF